MPDPKPNISTAGADNRRRMGWRVLVVCLLGAAASIALALPWWLRASLAFPAALSAVCFAQARCMTCVLRAGQGTFEGDDLSTVPAPADEVAASRRVSLGILRDSLLVGALAGAAAAATVWIR